MFFLLVVSSCFICLCQECGGISPILFALKSLVKAVCACFTSLWPKEGGLCLPQCLLHAYNGKEHFRESLCIWEVSTNLHGMALSD